MRVVTYSSRSHHDLVMNYLGRSSLKHGFDLIIQNGAQHGDGEFANAHWVKSMYDKTRCYAAAARLLKGEIVLFADADVVICHAFDGKDILKDVDLVAQCDRPNVICAGLFLARMTDTVQSYLDKVADSARFYNVRQPLSDQAAMNKLSMHLGQFKMAAPETFWTPGFDGTRWKRVADVDAVIIPDGILAAHANWMVGLENKRRMLNRIVAHYKLW